ncbi:MAG: Fic family protein [Erysipelotrichaceae bacterium]
MNRSGNYKSNLCGEMMYKSFIPNPLPTKPGLVLDEAICSVLVKANRAVAKLDAISSRLPNIPLFVSMYVRKEALLSSQIEGTQATLDDILNPYIERNTNQNVSDVINYIKATDFATERIKTLPLCCRLMLEIHQLLLSEVRGSEKNPGEFRRSQNWIGAQGSTLKTARYIPPCVEDMQIAMSDLEKYINEIDQTDALIRIALIHYQFETIHPFLDGNGRIGRLLVNLFLKENKLLSYPTLYISYFLKRNRIEYYDRLSEVREKGNFEQWVKFFLQGIYEAAEDSINSIDALVALHDKNLAAITAVDTRTGILKRLFAYLEQTPIIDIKKTASVLKTSYNTTDNAVKRLIKLGILIPVDNARRERSFAYEEYLEIFRKDT